MDRRRRGLSVLVFLVLLSSLILGCGGSSKEPGRDFDYEKAVSAAPAALKSFYQAGPVLMDGGEQSYDDLLEDARGYPVVVVNWASWCGPCITEFPYVRKAAYRLLRQVAFFGVNTLDTTPAYDTFVRDNPVPFPSVADPDQELAAWSDSGVIAVPNTLMYDAEGNLAYVHRGPYTSYEELVADIRTEILS